MKQPASSTADHFVVVTAGHVDHGKSTLVRALTGMEPDRLAEERRRGLSIELGFAWASFGEPATTVAFVDVPGHERFIATMLAGAGPAPAALFVVAADEGWSAQSTEHAEALSLLEVPVVAIALTKISALDEEARRRARHDLARQLAEFSMAQAPVVAVDSVHGEGLEELTSTVVDRLRQQKWPSARSRPRLWVDRVFSAAGAGTVVTGTLTGASVATNDELTVLPSGRRTRIRALQCLGADVDHVAPGRRVAINVAQVSREAVARGHVLVADGPWQMYDEVTAWVRVLEGQSVDRPGSWHLHVGTAEVACRVDLVAPGAGAGEPWQRAHSRAVRLRLSQPLPLIVGDRILLRDVGRRRVVAGGTIASTGPLPRVRRARREGLAVAVQRMAQAETSAQRLSDLVTLQGGSMPAAAAYAAAGWPSGDALPASLTAVGQWLVRDTELHRWRLRLQGLGDGQHSREDALRLLQTDTLDAGRDTTFAQAAVDHAVAEGWLVRTSGGYALAEHADQARHDHLQRVTALIAELDQAGLAPESLDVLARKHGVDHRQLGILEAEGRLIRFGRFALTPSTIAAAAEALTAVGNNGRAFTAAEAKQVWSTSRKFAIPLLEYFDRIGTTRFDGQLRTLQ